MYCVQPIKTSWYCPSWLHTCVENVEFKGCKKGFAGCDGGRMDSGDINLPGATPDKNRGEMKNGETHMYFIEM